MHLTLCMCGSKVAHYSVHDLKPLNLANLIIGCNKLTQCKIGKVHENCEAFRIIPAFSIYLRTVDTRRGLEVSQRLRLHLKLVTIRYKFGDVSLEINNIRKESPGH